MAGVIATLYDIGWSPIEPLQWADRSGAEWILAVGNEARAPLLRLLHADIYQAIWCRAAKHHVGSGLDSTPDMSAAIKHRKWLCKQNRAEEVGMLDTVLQGPCRTRTRRLCTMSMV